VYLKLFATYNEKYFCIIREHSSPANRIPELSMSVCLAHVSTSDFPVIEKFDVFHAIGETSLMSNTHMAAPSFINNLHTDIYLGFFLFQYFPGDVFVAEEL
jgi:hypothetical protein